MKKYIVYLILIFSIVLFRVISLQGKTHAYQSETVIEGLTAPRGRILDRNGHILVDNIGIKSLVFNELSLTNKEINEIAAKLSTLIDIKENVTDASLKKYYLTFNEQKINNQIPEDIKTKYNERKLSKKAYEEYKLSLITEENLKEIDLKVCTIYNLMKNGYSYENKIIKKKLTDEEYASITKENLKGIHTEITWERYYPYENTLKDIFGSVSSNGLPAELKDYYLDKGYKLNDRVGINNLELIYDDYLRGTKATYQVKNNFLSQKTPVIKGNDIVLNIDIELQKELEIILEEEMLKAKNAPNTKYYDTSYLIVSDPNTGGIISLVGKKITANQDFINYNYNAILDSYVVGSVVKGATISVGYKYDLLPKNRVVDGCVKLNTTKDKCSWKSLGLLDPVEALRMSSNYYQYLIAIKLTGKNYYRNMSLNANQSHFDTYRNMLKLYGLGTKSEIDLSNEETGYKGTTITDDQLLNISIGQYDAYTPISLVSYINTIATGNRYALNIFNEALNADGSPMYKKESKLLNTVPIDQEDLAEIRKGFHAVTKTGTGYGYIWNNYPSAGKTGTSESFLYLENNKLIKTIGVTLAAYLPYENPKISLVLVSPNIRYQNNVSNYRYPINQKIMKRASKLVIEKYLK